MAAADHRFYARDESRDRDDFADGIRAFHLHTVLASPAIGAYRSIAGNSPFQSPGAPARANRSRCIGVAHRIGYLPRMSASPSPGLLYVVATPIGNLGDMSQRAVEILRSAALVLAEDTRSFQVLASKFGIAADVQSCHEHNERGRIELAKELVAGGKIVALVSDAGTPLISDPGYRLVRSFREAGLPVSTVPGPCAAVAALTVSGFETDSFLFRGFVPVKDGRRRSFLAAALREPHTVILYESPHRVVKTAAALAEIDPAREVCIARELTKHFEEVRTGSAAEIHEWLAASSTVRGEFVVVIRRSEAARKRRGTEDSEDCETPDDPSPP